MKIKFPLHYTLTGVIIIFIYCLLALLGIIEDLVNSDPLILLDQRINQFFVMHRNPLGIKVFMAITSLGSWYVIILAIIAIALILWYRKKKNQLLPFLASTLGAYAIVYLGKLLFARPRPPYSVYLESNYSFPSGHATMAMMLFGFLAYFIFENSKNKNAKALLIFLLGLIILLVGLSRIYLGVHYTSDVLGGWLLGSLWLLINIGIITYQEQLPVKKK